MLCAGYKTQALGCFTGTRHGVFLYACPYDFTRLNIACTEPNRGEHSLSTAVASVGIHRVTALS